MKTVLLALTAIAAPAVAQAPDWRTAQPLTVTMTDHGFVPRNIVLRRGGLYVLYLANRSDKGHNFTQKAFFAAARVRGDDRRWTANGQIVLAAGERATVHFQAPFTRSGGTFQFSSTTLGDADDDYKGVFEMR